MIKRFGTRYGGFYYPKDLKHLNKDSIIYCIGAGEDISHDLELATTLKSDVHIFDPTPRAVDHINLVYSVMDNNDNVVVDDKIGGGDPDYWNYVVGKNIERGQIKFYPYGVGSTCGILKFYQPTNLNHVSHSLIPKDQNSSFIDVEIKDMVTIMTELGHGKIDLLKMDIEGSEFEVIAHMIENNVLPRYIAVELHPHKTNTDEEYNTTIGSLLSKGYSLLHRQNNDYTFVLDN